jgi:hypothetical protein
MFFGPHPFDFRLSAVLVRQAPDHDRAVVASATGSLADREARPPVEKSRGFFPSATWVDGAGASNRPPCRPRIGTFAELSSPKGT